jgi:hypothetical protein
MRSGRPGNSHACGVVKQSGPLILRCIQRALRRHCSRGAERLPAHGLVGVAIREIYFPSDAARVIKRGELDSVRIAGAKPRTITVNAIIEIGIEVPYFFDFDRDFDFG